MLEQFNDFILLVYDIIGTAFIGESLGWDKAGNPGLQLGDDFAAHISCKKGIDIGGIVLSGKEDKALFLSVYPRDSPGVCCQKHIG